MTNGTQRPRRQKKGDRLLDRTASQNEIECDKAVAVMDRLAIQMDERWAVDRLPELVSVETAQKYGSALAKLNAALEAGEPQEVAKRAQVCMRGLKAMNEEAEAAGQPKAAAEFLEYDLDGFRFGVLKDPDCWPACKKVRPDLKFYTMREVALALQERGLSGPTISKVKDLWPGAQVTRIGGQNVDLEDQIPF